MRLTFSKIKKIPTDRHYSQTQGRVTTNEQFFKSSLINEPLRSENCDLIPLKLKQDYEEVYVKVTIKIKIFQTILLQKILQNLKKKLSTFSSVPT